MLYTLLFFNVPGFLDYENRIMIDDGRLECTKFKPFPSALCVVTFDPLRITSYRPHSTSGCLLYRLLYPIQLAHSLRIGGESTGTTCPVIWHPMSTINSPCWCHDNTLRKELEQVIQETLSPAKKSGKRKRQTLVSRKALQEVVQGFWLVVVGLKYVGRSRPRSCLSLILVRARQAGILGRVRPIR
jgi:hypothetical protein